MRALNLESCLKVRSQRYCRWSHRRPAAIVNEDELFDVEEEEDKPKKKVKPIKVSKKKQKRDDEKKSTLLDSTDTLPNTSNMFTRLRENDKMIR